MIGSAFRFLVKSFEISKSHVSDDLDRGFNGQKPEELDFLEVYLPKKALDQIKIWLKPHVSQVRLKNDRLSKLGDYSFFKGIHKITINNGLPPQLFLFVLTHEIAHLHAFVHFGYKIRPHGTEWKSIYRNLLLDTVHYYEEDFRLILLEFAQNPKANYMASPAVVRYFDEDSDNKKYIEDLETGNQFYFRDKEYQLLKKSNKKYLCKNLENKRVYVFHRLAKVIKTN